MPRPLVLTNGVFDLLHVGHVRYLESARQAGRWLLVAVNDDASALVLGKGPGRPVVPEAQRREMVAALKCVDAAVLFDGDVVRLIRALRPEVYCKGGDYGTDTPDAAAAREVGATVLQMPFVPGCSTSDLVERIRAA